MKKLYDFSQVLYKTDDTPGWNIALLYGTEEEVKNKAKNLWTNYQIFSGNQTVYFNDDSFPINPEPEMTHLTSYWTYSKELNKWFLKDELIPLPSSDCEKTNSFNITFYLPKDQNELSELVEIYNDNKRDYDLDDVEIYVSVIYHTAKKCFQGFLSFSKSVLEDFVTFKNELQTKSFSNLYMKEYNYLKILGWVNDGKCRIKIQSYDYHDYVREPIDFEMPFENFISSFDSFINKLSLRYSKINDKVRKLSSM